MILLLPFYCPNCKNLAFLAKDQKNELVDFAQGHWGPHGCREFQGLPLAETELVQKLINLPPGEGFAFRYRPGGYRGHGAPSDAVVLRLADATRNYHQVITPDNGLFEIKFSSALGLVQGSVVQLGKARRLTATRYRVDDWAAMQTLPSTEVETHSEVYRLTLQAEEQETLEAHCTRMIKYFEKAGTPVLSIIPKPIQQGPEVKYIRQLVIGSKVDVVLALEKVNLPGQMDYSIHQVDRSQIYEG